MDVASCVFRKVALVFGAEGRNLQGEEEWEVSGETAALPRDWVGWRVEGRGL